MNPLNASQIHILQALANGPTTRAGLSALLGNGVSLSADNLGPVTDDPLDRGSNPDSLRARGLVGVNQQEDEPAVFYITPEGRKWAARSAARSRMADNQRIPNKVLDPAVLAVKKHKSYGLELFTSEDIMEVRSACLMQEIDALNNADMSAVEALTQHYAAVEDDNIRLQMTNRRKQGAYADKDAKVKANLVKLGKLLREFNVRISEDSEAELDELCDNYDLPPILQIED